MLLPSARGLLSALWIRLLWRPAQLLPGRVGHHAQRAAGPLSIVVTIASWVVLLWIAFGLCYLPDVGNLGFSSDVRFEGNDVVAALYLSGTVLTTLGLGDVAAQSDGLRLLVVLQSAAGLAVFTAALGYLPAIYTVVSDLRTSAEAVSDLRAITPGSAVDLLRDDAVVTLESVRRDVISARQHLLRFPVLHYFHPPAAQSVMALVEGAAMLWTVARFGIAGDGHRGIRRQGESLELALRRLVDDMARHVGEHLDDDGRDEARQQVEQVRRAVGELPDGQVDTSEVDGEALDDLARTNAVLRRYADLHAYPRPGA